MLAAPAVSCAKVREKCAHEHTGTVGAFRHSLHNGFTAYAVLSLRRLDTSHGRQGPHGFAVRFSAVLLPRPRSLTGQKPALPSASRNRRCRVHRIPSPPSVTIAIRPSWWAGTRRFYRVEKCGTVTSSRIKKADFSMSKATGAKGRFDQLAAGKGHSGQRIASMPLRRITSSKTSAGPVGRLTPRSSCETYPTVRLR